MKIDGIKLNKEGLVKLIEFIHGEANFYTIGTAREKGKTMIFVIKEIIPILSENKRDESCIYEVVVEQHFLGCEREFMDPFFNLLLDIGGK